MAPILDTTTLQASLRRCAEASSSGISSLRSSAPIKPFLPTPSPAWQQVHTELRNVEPFVVHPLPTPSAAWKTLCESIAIQAEMFDIDYQLRQEDAPPAAHKSQFSICLGQLMEVLCQRQHYGASLKDKAIHRRLHMAVMQQLPSHYDKITKMTMDDNIALRFYCNNAFWKVNSALRKCADRNGAYWHQDENIVGRISGIRKALHKRVLKARFPGVVYRGSNVPDDVRAKLVEGATYQDDGFLSTSKRELEEFKGSVAFVIKSRTGASVKRYSMFDEDEILFQPGTMFRIVKTEDEGNTLRVWMYEMV